MKIVKNDNIVEKCQLRDISSIGRKKKTIDDDSDITFLGMADIQQTVVSPQKGKYKDYKKGFTYFEENDVLVAKITPCFENGKGAIVEKLYNGVGFGSTEFFVLTNKDNNKYLSLIIKYITQSSRFRKLGATQMVGGGGQRRVPRDFIECYPISKFSIAYYEKIAKILVAQETHINNIKELISKLETRNEQMAERLLSGELRVREDANGEVEFYKNADDNWKEVKLNGKMRIIPKDWGVDLLKNIIELKKGTSISSSLLNHDNLGDQYIRTNEIWDTSAKTKDPVFYNGDLKVNKKTDQDYIICFDGYNSSPKEGTLGMVTNNGIGIMSGELFKIGEIDNVSKIFVNLYYLKLSYFQELICRYGEGSTVKHAGKHVKKIDMPKIPIDEQENLNNFFESYEVEINSLKSLMKKEKVVFEQLSEALLSGEYIIEE